MPMSNIFVIQALDKLRAYNLFVHNDLFPGLSFENEKLKNRKVYLVETLATINALADNGTMLLYGGHGGGKTTLSKYLGQIFYHLTSDEIEGSVLRGHPQLTEEKILGNLDISQLTGRRDLTDGRNIDVNWNDFVIAPWKIIDEINRLTPYAQNILLSLLAEGVVKYHNAVKVIPPFTLFATMNPKDEANSNLSLPFLDRFALALPITMPDYESLLTIGKRSKTNKTEALSNYLPHFDLSEYQDVVRNIPISEDAENYINLIIAEFRLCERVAKEASINETVDGNLCKGCHFEDAVGKVCNKVVNPLSVRVKEDLFRYSKALAWLLGAESVTYKHVESLAPYMIWHRSNISRKYTKALQEARFASSNLSININLEACKAIIGIISSDFEYLKTIQHKYSKLKKGELEPIEFEKFNRDVNDPNQNHLLVTKEIRYVFNNEYRPVYDLILQINNKIKSSAQVDDLKGLKDEILFNYELPNRQFLVDEIDKRISRVTNDSFRPITFNIDYEALKVSLENIENLFTIRVSTIFHGDFAPELMRPYVLFNAPDDGFELRLTRHLNKLKVEYRGAVDTEVHKYLNTIKIGQ